MTALAQESVSTHSAQTLDAPSAPLEGRSAQRFALGGPVRIGWISDRRRMQYDTVECVDISESGISVRVRERLRHSALVHLELEHRAMGAVGRVVYCVRDGKTNWRVGLEVLSAFPSETRG